MEITLSGTTILALYAENRGDDYDRRDCSM